MYRKFYTYVINEKRKKALTFDYSKKGLIVFRTQKGVRDKLENHYLLGKILGEEVKREIIDITRLVKRGIILEKNLDIRE